MPERVILCDDGSQALQAHACRASVGRSRACALAVGWQFLLAGEEDAKRALSHAPPRVRPVRLTPEAERVALTFVESVRTGRIGRARRLIDATYPCGEGRPPKKLRQAMLRTRRFRLPAPVQGEQVSFDVGFAAGNALWVELIVPPSGGPGVAYVMQLRRHGSDTWRVGYLDTVWGPVTPFLCAGAAN